MRPIEGIVVIGLCAAALFSPTATLAAAPATLTCIETTSMNWRVDPPVTASPTGDELEGVLIHLDPASGEWFLQVPGSRALTNDGGTFEVRRDSAFGAYHHEWVGIDHDTMLRVRGGGSAPLRFVFVSDGNGLLVGECAEPDEPFIFLSPRGGS